MGTISKASLSTIRRRADDLLETLGRQHPIEIQELKLLLEVMRQREHSTGSDFAGVRSPRRAIELCLAERGSAMTKQEIIDRLVEGGFLKDPATEKWLINDNINLGIKKGFFAVTGGGEGLSAQVELSSPAKPTK